VAWRKANPEKLKAIDAVYRANNLEEIKARRAAHPEANRTAGTRYAARKKALPATLTTEQWIAILAAYKHRCAYCGVKESKKSPLTQDHVIPLSKGGGTTKENIVPACLSCNSKKRSGLPSKPVRLVLL
jgi:5-methylcytosine-specific restriction endonuclease McrA